MKTAQANIIPSAYGLRAGRAAPGKARLAATAPSSREEACLPPAFLAAGTVLCAVLGLSGWWMAGAGQPGLSIALYAGAYLAGGWVPVRKILASLARKELDVNFLMLLAALGAALLGDWGEGAALLFLFSLSDTLEAHTLERTARSIEALIELRPETVTVMRGGKARRVPLGELKAGERVRIWPAERLGVDGVIEEGRSGLDESTLTGESLSVEKGPGEEVFAGTLNHRGTLLVRVTGTASETLLAKIVKQVRAAQEEKTRLERRIGRWQPLYVLAVLAGALAAGWAAWAFGAAAPGEAFYYAMILLVAASPCALVISAPAAVLAGLTRGARRGVLFKNGAALERLAAVRAFGLDKTGTVTCGQPEVREVYEASGRAAGRADLLAQAASVEQHSEHVLGRAVVAEARRGGRALAKVRDFESRVGCGVHARLDGEWVGVGREPLFENAGRAGRALPQAVLEKARRMRAEGLTALLVRGAGNLAGVIGLADRVRPEAQEALARLRKLGVERIELLTGDHERVGAAVARTVRADGVRHGQLPGDKVASLKEMRRTHGPAAFVGDGVNDAPALATAHVGIAMGGAGTDVALQSADVVLMRDDLKGLVFAKWLSLRTRAAVRRGMAIALGSIALNVLFALFGLVPLWLAVLIHEGSTVLAILSGLYLLVAPAPKA